MLAYLLGAGRPGASAVSRACTTQSASSARGQSQSETQGFWNPCPFNHATLQGCQRSQPARAPPITAAGGPGAKRPATTTGQRRCIWPSVCAAKGASHSNTRVSVFHSNRPGRTSCLQPSAVWMSTSVGILRRDYPFPVSVVLRFLQRT